MKFNAAQMDRYFERRCVRRCMILSERSEWQMTSRHLERPSHFNPLQRHIFGVSSFYPVENLNLDGGLCSAVKFRVTQVLSLPMSDDAQFPQVSSARVPLLCSVQVRWLIIMLMFCKIWNGLKEQSLVGPNLSWELVYLFNQPLCVLRSRTVCS